MILAGLAVTSLIPEAVAASADPQAEAIDRANRALLAKTVGTDKETPETRKLAERPDIQAAFEAYRTAGGLAPKHRFAHAFAATSGFTGGPLAGLIEDATPPPDASSLKAHPIAFDLVCEPRPNAPEKADVRAPKAADDKDRQEPPRELRFSIDVAAGLWRSGKAYVQTMHIGERGKLVTKWHIDLEHVTWGAPVYDRLSRSYDETVTTTTLTSRRPSTTSVHATCRLAPYSKLFGAGR